MAKLTKRVVDAARPRERDYFVWCDELPRFGVRVFASGKKSYLIQYRNEAGQTRRLSLGPHGPLTPEMARELALLRLAEVAMGDDPAACRAERRQDLTVAELCDRWLDGPGATLKPGSLASYRSAIERHIKPLLGRRRLQALTVGDIERLHADVAAGRTGADQKTGPRGRAIVRGGRTIAARAVDYLSAILGFAVRSRWLPSNPARGLRLTAARRPDRFLSLSEIARLGEVLEAAEAEGQNPVFIAALRLLLLTGCRKNEVLRLRWDEVDLEGGQLRLFDSKTGPKTVPLGAPALALLAELPRTSSPYVLPASRGNGPAVGLQKFWERVRRRAGFDGMRVHDLRHAFASVAVAGGDSLFLVGKVLGHRQARMTERYSHVKDDPVRAVADRASTRIAAALQRGGGEVVGLPSRKAER